MQVSALVRRPLGSREEIDGRESRLSVWHVVVDVHCIVYGHRPKGGVGSIGPTNGGVEHHCACHRHDGLDAPLRDPIVMMRSDTGEVADLLEGSQLLCVITGRESGPIVRAIGLNDNTGVAGSSFELVLGL